MQSDTFLNNTDSEDEEQAKEDGKSKGMTDRSTPRKPIEKENSALKKKEEDAILHIGMLNRPWTYRIEGSGSQEQLFDDLQAIILEFNYQMYND